MKTNIEEEIRGKLKKMTPQQRAALIGREIMKTPTMSKELKQRVQDWLVNPYQLEERWEGLREVFDEIIDNHATETNK